MKSAFLLLPVLALCTVARAESPDSIPDPRQTNRSSIYDGARVLDNAQKQRIDARINALEKKTGAQLLVVTVQTLDGMPIEDYANSVFRRIGVGNKGNDEGAMFLFAIRDHKSRLEVSPGLQDRLTDARGGVILREDVPPAFRRGDYGGGILIAVQSAANIIEGGKRPVSPSQTAPHFPPSASTSSPSSGGSGKVASSNGFPSNSSFPSGSFPSTNSYPAASPSSSGSGLLWLGLLAAGGIGGLMYLGSRPRKCPRCQTDMQETEAPSSELSPANQCEQAIGSRHFARYSCPKCAFVQIEPRNVAFSRFTQCAACRNLTAQRISRVLQQPTYTSTGVEETTEQCLFPPCQHVSRRQRTLSRLQRSSSGVVVIGGGMGGFGGGFGGDGGGSSGGGYDGGASGGFGGGDSDGGGASGSW